MTTRRNIVFAGTAFPLIARACTLRAQNRPPVLIGWFEASTRSQNINRVNAFKEGMTALGWKEGTHYVLEERWAQGQIDRLPELAREIAAKKPAIIVAAPSQPCMEAAK